MAISKIKTNSISDDAITAAKIADGTIVAADLAADSVDSSELVNGSVDLAHMSVNSIDSDQYVDGSIDTAHIADDQVTLAKMAGLARGKIIYGDASGDPAALTVGSANTVLKSDGTDVSYGTIATANIAADAIDGTKLADNAVDSEHYTDGSIDLAHMSVNSIDSDQYVDGSIDTAHIADDQVTLAKMAGLARGKIIYGDASGDPAALTVGSNGQALVSDGTDISWGSAGASLANDGNNRIVTGDGSGGLNGEANLTFDGTNLDLGDSKKIRLGASQDLEIYHDGSHSIIKDGGIGNLQIRGEDVKLYNPDATETLAEFIFNGANKFYYNNNLRAKTVDEGFNVGHRLSVGAVEVPSNPNIRFLMDETSYDLGVGTYAGNLANGYGSWDLTGADKKITVIHAYGRLAIANSGATCVDLNRCSNDGEIISFRQDATQEGTISVSGSTIAYNTFCGTHWSRLADNSKPTILRGTVMESIDEVMDWYQAKFLPSTLEDIPDNYVKQPIALPEGKNVGDTFEYTTMPPEGQSSETVTATIIKEDNEQLPKVKVSDTEDSKAVYGVFMDWDDTDDGEDGDVNDMNVASLGAFVVRIHKDETVAIGDYLQSKGDGTAKVQADDIMRASTIAKVTSTEKTHIHADSSYCVPCTLHCG